MQKFVEVGIVKELNRFPVKSMQGESLSESHVFWHGLDGDRRYAFVRSDILSGFPWLTGRQIPSLVRYQPSFTDPNDVANSPVVVTTVNGRQLPINAPELQQELAEAYGKPTHLIQIGRGVFDSQVISLMSNATVAELNKLAGMPLTAERFRQNIIVETIDKAPFAEEEWMDGVLTFGDAEDGARIHINRRIPRCVMINIDPETAVTNAAVLKMVAQQRDSCVGVYASTEKTGMIRVGDVIRLRRK